MSSLPFAAAGQIALAETPATHTVSTLGLIVIAVTVFAAVFIGLKIYSDSKKR